MKANAAAAYTGMCTWTSAKSRLISPGLTIKSVTLRTPASNTSSASLRARVHAAEQNDRPAGRPAAPRQDRTRQDKMKEKRIENEIMAYTKYFVYGCSYLVVLLLVL